MAAVSSDSDFSIMDVVISQRAGTQVAGITQLNI